MKPQGYSHEYPTGFLFKKIKGTQGCEEIPSDLAITLHEEYL